MTDVELNRRIHLLPTVPEAPPIGSLRAARRHAGDRLRLARFFLMLGLKERVAPRLHVRPLVAELFLTDNCNLACVSCACWRSTTRGELSTDEWCDVIDQLARLRFLKLNFTGGEPLIRRDAVGLMAYARGRGIPSIHLNSNALLLTESKIDDVLRAGVRSFNISVDGPNAHVHDAIRGKTGAFDTTVAALRRLIARRDAYGLKIRMNFTVLRDNVAWLPDIAEMAARMGVRLYLNLGTDTTFLFRSGEVSEHVTVEGAAVDEALGRLEPVARRSGEWMPRYSDLRYVRRHFSDLVQRDLPCAESQLKLMVHSQGGVGGCWGHDPTMNVRERSVREIIDHPAYRDEHARFFRKDCIGCGSNYSLNLRWRPSTYLADLLWKRGRRTLSKP